MTEPTVLRGEGRTGDFVHESQNMGQDAGFRNVSQRWLDQCLSYEQALATMAKQQSSTEDFMAPLGTMTPDLNDQGDLVIRQNNGRELRPTEYAVKQMAGWAQVSTWFTGSLLKDPVDRNGEALFERDRKDRETLARVLVNGLRRLDRKKVFLWRTRTDGTLRAMLTDGYAILNNEWVLKTMQQLIPSGLVSHWRGDADTLYANILIPDTLREETDSAYGGMESIGNSEIGKRKVGACPSVFRAICQNGCIWDQTRGQRILRRHRGSIDLDQLFLAIKANLEKQIPLLPQGIDKMLGTRKWGWDGASMLPLFSQVARDYSLSRSQATAVLVSYNKERDRSLFGVVNAVTRTGQRLSNAEWVRFDEIGGTLANLDKSGWTSLTSRAKKLKTREVEDSFASITN